MVVACAPDGADGGCDCVEEDCIEDSASPDARSAEQSKATNSLVIRIADRDLGFRLITNPSSLVHPPHPFSQGPGPHLLFPTKRNTAMILQVDGVGVNEGAWMPA